MRLKDVEILQSLLRKNTLGQAYLFEASLF